MGECENILAGTTGVKEYLFDQISEFADRHGVDDVKACQILLDIQRINELVGMFGLLDVCEEINNEFGKSK